MKKKTVISVIILLIAAISIYVAYSAHIGRIGLNKAITVKVTEVSKGDISSYVSASGILEEKERAEVYFDSSLKVKSILVTLYQRVKKGDKLVELDLENMSSDLKATGLDKKLNNIEASTLSPIDGIITNINVKAGAFTTAAQPAFVIINPDNLQVRANIREANIRDVKKGQNVNITGDAFNKDESITGTVESISPIALKVKTSTGEETVAQAIISIKNTSVDLMPGLNVSCDIQSASKTGVLVVSSNVLAEDKDKNMFVYVVDPNNNIVHKRAVKLGIVSDMNAEITEGLSEGEMVVIDPKPSLEDGMKVKISNLNKK